jgi:repressor LexA
MTETGLNILEFIKGYMSNNYKIRPTVREIGDGCGITSTASVKHHLSKLEQEGFIKRHKGIRSRNILVKGIDY